MRVVLTREAGTNASLREWTETLGDVVEVPLTSTRYFARDEVAASLAATGLSGVATTLVVTSARSRDYVALAAGALAPDGDVLAVGPVTAAAVVESGVAVTVVGSRGAGDLAAHVGAGPVILLGASEPREDLADVLGARGVVLRHVACYETRARALDDGEVAALRGADVVVVGAPSAWAVARDLVAPDAWVSVPGATTAAAVSADHGRVLVGWGPDLGERLRAVVDGGPRSNG